MRGVVEARLLTPAGAADENEPVIACEQPPCLDEPLEVLARLERADAEDVRPAECGPVAVGDELGPDARIRDDETLRLDAERRDGIVGSCTGSW